MAKAIAGESGVPLLAYNSTDFDVIVGGVGAKRVRAVFDEARKLVGPPPWLTAHLLAQLVLL